MCFKKIGAVVFLFYSVNTFATAYIVPPADQSLIGKPSYEAVSRDDTVTTIAKKYDLGHNAMMNANPQVDPLKAFKPDTLLQIPSQHLLPNQARVGIIVNLPEMRMYYYVPHTQTVYSYPVGIGKIGNTIPITEAVVTRKVKDPVWVPPDDIREFNLKQGVILPKIMPAGPDNPLGPYAIYTSIPTYLIHSTIFPESIGRRASFGCIRMYESDIQTFFPTIAKGIPVSIINTPIKSAWHKEKLYIEVYPPLEEHSNAFDASLAGSVHIVNSLSKDQPVLVDWQGISYIAMERDGVPHDIGVRIEE
ncbi:MAG TPA: L,D-transpeptidase family protein [Gammaproteobacteria bacterium]|jgi:L,D-transpeptidase ErfK/SrfK|nr:L,D-transpeptidase family protein [Gammaproteobacteria bacterium]